MHDAITVGIPVLAILFGVLWNNQGLRDLKVELKSELKELRTEMLGQLLSQRNEMIGQRAEMMGHLNRIEGKTDRLQADLAQFYRILGEHGARLDNLEKS